MLHILSTFLASFITLAITGSCPPGAVEYNEGEECLLGINAPTNYWGAASTCEMLGGRLVQPTSALENILAGSQGIQTLNGQSAYIGVARNNGVWRYSDGTPLVYQNWKNGTGHPGEDCAAFGASDLSWYPGTCATFHPFICSFSNQLTNGCPAGWKYYRFTDSCYHASAWNFADPALLPLSVGVTRCRNVGADLVSIHSERENHFVHELAWTVRENWNVTRCTAASSNMFVIGLAFNGRDTEVPEWTDGTAYDYTAVDRAGLASYGVYNDPICSSTRSCVSVLCAVAFTVASAGNCPSGSFDYSDGRECLVGINADAEYSVALQTCKLIDGRLVQPRNALENAMAGFENIQTLKGQAGYIGVARVNGTWGYADGTSLAYQNWKNGTGSVGQDCAGFRGSDLSWYPVACSTRQPFICSFSYPLVNNNCPAGWSFYQATGYCYYAPAWNFADPDSYTIDQGESMCRGMGGNLVSIHSNLENRFVFNLIASVRQNWNITSCPISPVNYSCPNGWTRYENYCYYTPSASNWGPQPPNITFASGEALCVQNQAHLVSIHSEAENNFVNGLYADAIGNYTSGCSIRLEGVIGLSGGTWTDGTPVDFTNGGDLFPPGCKSVAWDGWNLDEVYASFICKRPANQ
ncbi:unnamed protein product, partial [Mesorhabditis spiculigera]